ncbi:thiol:disulfide interchange protein DsbA/DsbL [Methylomicrobium sp. Wu6]|uniref:thiol:disulfide interchange protein DsbA/DsbL n=1 Tax=Methylomicrobium sp. Wu6 TaxID=3107928 RepID=UPI002DD61B6D|nr:thiol:disulfide interchange protein DsbA/DsbL [Methylomicrobium sp. Wu6]MEC4748825.1 thiol:disulfide interchange protein DsbA/DsbL [Methylomicrobium sp. Wu6]
MSKNFLQIGLIILILAVLAGVSAFFYLKMQKQPGSEAAAPEQTTVTPPAAAVTQPIAEAAPAQTAALQPAGESTAPAPTEQTAAPAESPAAEELTGYETLATPQPTQNPDKIEVIEFFWYGCPHCYDFEPILESWVKKMPVNVDFIRQPAAFSDLWAKHAKAFYVAQALGVLDKVHADFFDALQNKHQKLETEEQLGAFFAAHGVKEADFHDAYNSFLVDTKVRQAAVTPARYGVTGVPVLIVNGKYKVDGKSAGSHEKMIEVMNQLIKKESAAKK